MTRVTALFLALATLIACSGGSSSVFDPPPAPRVAPGEVLPLNMAVTIDTSGTYPLPSGASTIRVVCTGLVAVILEDTPGSPQVNTCESDDGSGSQLNDVSGLSSVAFDLDTGASARTTVN